jgi:hypothetical protein
MIDYVRFCVADILVNGIAGMVVCFVAYLLFLAIYDRKRRREYRRREMERKGYWGFNP